MLNWRYYDSPDEVDKKKRIHPEHHIKKRLFKREVTRKQTKEIINQTYAPLVPDSLH